MSSIAVRIPKSTHERLRQLAEAEHKSIGEVASELLDAYEREKFWREYERTSAEAQADPELRRAMQKEQREFDGTLMDGLQDAPWNDA